MIGYVHARGLNHIPIGFTVSVCRQGPTDRKDSTERTGGGCVESRAALPRTPAHPVVIGLRRHFRERSPGLLAAELWQPHILDLATQRIRRGRHVPMGPAHVAGR